MKGSYWLFVVLSVFLAECSVVDEAHSHKLVKRQLPPRSGDQRAFPLSRSRQYPPPEELDETEEYVTSEDEEKGPIAPFRGRQPQQPPPEDSDDYSYTEAPKLTTAQQRPTARTVVFNNRFNARPRFGSQNSNTSVTTAAPRLTTEAAPRSRFRATPAQSQRLDVVADILNKPPPARPSQRSIAVSRTGNENTGAKPVVDTAINDASTRRNGNNRVRARGRPRSRISSTTTTTTTTTTPAPVAEEEYYYYYEDAEEADKNQPVATTTSTTTTTTTTPRPSLPKRPSIARRPSGGRTRVTTRPVVKFDLESQFAPPPDDISEVSLAPESGQTKRFTTSTTTALPEGGIPAHLRSKYRPRTDGRFIDFLRDPNRPRELKGFDLTDYPFYITVPEDIDFECTDKKDGYYASIPHRCQLFHYCFAGARYDFLCANYTLYDQTTFTCRFANNVDCESSAKYYYRNDDLWKETTTVAPETTTKRKRTTPKEEDYEDEYDYEDYEDEEDRRRRPAKRRRNRRKNKRKESE